MRLEGGRALLGDDSQVELPANLLTKTGNGRREAYIRPHELDISRTAQTAHCLSGKILHINPAGSVVKVRLLAEDFGLMINVDVSPEQYRTLALKPGDEVYVQPKNAKIFDPDYAI